LNFEEDVSEKNDEIEQMFNVARQQCSCHDFQIKDPQVRAVDAAHVAVEVVIFCIGNLAGT